MFNLSIDLREHLLVDYEGVVNAVPAKMTTP